MGWPGLGWFVDPQDERSAERKVSGRTLPGQGSGARRGDLRWMVEAAGELGSSLPMLTGVVRCDPVVRGPDVAPSVRAWKARPDPPVSRHAAPTAQARPHPRPSAVDRGRPSVAGATGTRRARPARTNPARALQPWSPPEPEGEAHPGDTSLRWQGPQARGSYWVRGSNPAPGCFAVQANNGEWPVACDADSLTLTARARRGPAVPDAVRTQHGPGRRATASLGSTLGPLGTGRSYSLGVHGPTVVVRG